MSYILLTPENINIKKRILVEKLKLLAYKNAICPYLPPKKKKIKCNIK